MASKKSFKRRNSESNISMKCKTCEDVVNDVDSHSVSVICHKCVARQLNPGTIFVDDLSKEKWAEIREKL